MGLLKYFALLAMVFAIAYVYLSPAALDLEQFKINDEHWGLKSEKGRDTDKSIRKYQISFAANKIEELRRKLGERYEFTPALEDAEKFEYGMNVENLTNIIKYWRDDYLPRWKEREALFNQLPHYKTKIQGLDLHFIHAKPPTSAKKVVPILLLHGWPGSVREFYEFIPLLTKPHADVDVVFEVIAPSLPGYGWSDPAKRTGFSAIKMAVVLRNLMIRLGKDRFVIQGGDWGSILGNLITTLYPENVIAYHSNMCVFSSPKMWAKLFIASFKPSWFIDKEYEHMVFPVGEKIKFLLRETGYFHIQATKPDTVGAALTNSPVALAAYILEKFSSFSGSITLDAMLDNLMVYYFTNSFTTAIRLYAETFRFDFYNYSAISRIPTDVPAACARFEKDINHMLDWHLKDKFLNLVQSTYHLDGGHFAAFEEPHALHDDFIQFISKWQLLDNRK